MSRCGGDTADGRADSGKGVAGKFGECDGANVSRHAGIECERRSVGGDGDVHEPGGDSGHDGSSDVCDGDVRVCGCVGCGDGVAGVDGSADRADGGDWGQLDEDCYYGVCAGGNLRGLVLRGGGYDSSDAVLQLDSAGRNYGDGV